MDAAIFLTGTERYCRRRGLCCRVLRSRSWILEGGRWERTLYTQWTAAHEPRSLSLLRRVDILRSDFEPRPAASRSLLSWSSSFLGRHVCARCMSLRVVYKSSCRFFADENTLLYDLALGNYVLIECSSKEPRNRKAAHSLRKSLFVACSLVFAIVFLNAWIQGSGNFKHYYIRASAKTG